MALDISAALTAAQETFGQLKDAVEARSNPQIRAALGKMAIKLTDVQLSALSVAERLAAVHASLAEANAELRTLKESTKVRANYVLREVRPGAYVRAFQPVDGDPTPPHKCCQVCFDRGEISVLEATTSGNILRCKIDRAHNVTVSDYTPRIGGNDYDPFSRV